MWRWCSIKKWIVYNWVIPSNSQPLHINKLESMPCEIINFFVCLLIIAYIHIPAVVRTRTKFAASAKYWQLVIWSRFIWMKKVQIAELKLKPVSVIVFLLAHMQISVDQNRISLFQSLSLFSSNLNPLEFFQDILDFVLSIWQQCFCIEKRLCIFYSLKRQKIDWWHFSIYLYKANIYHLRCSKECSRYISSVC